MKIIDCIWKINVTINDHHVDLVIQTCNNVNFFSRQQSVWQHILQPQILNVYLWGIHVQITALIVMNSKLTPWKMLSCFTYENIKIHVGFLGCRSWIRGWSSKLSASPRKPDYIGAVINRRVSIMFSIGQYSWSHRKKSGRNSFKML